MICIMSRQIFKYLILSQYFKWSIEKSEKPKRDWRTDGQTDWQTNGEQTKSPPGKLLGDL